jgi:hypothetical protein
MMKKAEYIDERGRKYQVLIPDDAPLENAHMGIVVGPPDVADMLNIPEPFATRLHNAFYRRKIFSALDVKRRPNEVASAIGSALAIDVAEIHAKFIALETKNETNDNYKEENGGLP